ncbi:glycosyltransferase family 4 protein [Neobacillus drentensis]|uniref:glycosyltransferase family 4 protein n=1 Tax=Neobacillus drentensis TaxID=220684 RepID=UPI002FFDD6ED
MKILFIMPRYHTNQYYVMKTLIDNGYDVEVIVRYVGQSEDYSIVNPKNLGYSKLFERLFGLIKKYLPNRKDPNKFERQFGFPPIISIIKLFKQSKSNIVIIRDIDSVYSVMSFLLSWIFKKGIIIYTQIPKYSEGRKLILLQKIINQFFNVTWITPTRIEKNTESIVHKDTYYLPFVYEPSINILKKRYFINNRINILMIGKFQENKNHLLLLQAINKLKDKYPIMLTIIGEKSNLKHERYYNKVIEYINENKLTTIVIIKLNLTFKDVQTEYEKQDLFIIPSQEPASVSLLEAMSFALPVISSNKNGTKCYIKNGSNGFVFEEGNLNNLVKSIEKVINSRETLVAMGKKSHELVLSEHSPEMYYNNFCKMVLEKGFNTRKNVGS